MYIYMYIYIYIYLYTYVYIYSYLYTYTYLAYFKFGIYVLYQVITCFHYPCFSGTESTSVSLSMYVYTLHGCIVWECGYLCM